MRAIVLAALGLSLSCVPSGEETGPPANVAAAAARAVQVAPELVKSGRIALGVVERKSADATFRATGRVRPDIDGEALVSALAPGVVRRVHVREGQEVKAGDLLAEMDVPDAARVAGELARARATRKQARKTLAREQELISFGGTSQAELEAAEANLALARADESASRALLSTWGTRSGHLRIRAPIRGRVVHRQVALGASVESGDELFRVVDLDKLVVSANVLERDAHRVSVGMTAKLRLLSGNQCSAEVEAVSGEVETGQRSVAVRLRARSCKGLLAGQLVHVELHGGTAGATEALAVPRDALVSIDGRHTVFVAGDAEGTFVAYPVTVARFTNVSAWLESGPEAGTQIAVRGVILLKGELLRATLE